MAFVTGTGTEIGKTWLSCQLLSALRQSGLSVAARKPVQSLESDDPVSDAELLGAASGERPEQVCSPENTFRKALAPPIAAEALGAPAYRIADLANCLILPSSIDIAIVEGAGGLLSPLAADGDNADLAILLSPAYIIVVARSDLGAIHEVRATLSSLASRLGAYDQSEVVVFLNRFDADDPVHRENLRWLDEHVPVAFATRVDQVTDLILCVGPHS